MNQSLRLSNDVFKEKGRNVTLGLTMKKQRLIKFTALLVLMFSSAAQAIQVTVSVPPLAGLLKPLLDESDEIVVLLKPGVSPHGFQLKPSHLKAIQSSDALFSIGTPVDGWIEKTLSRVETPVIRMSGLEGLQTLPIRNGGLWIKPIQVAHSENEEAHSHAHEAHGYEHDAQNQFEKKKAKWHYDGHIWLSMQNARLFVESAAELIKTLKPMQVESIEQKKQAWLAQLSQLDQDLKAKLTSVKDQPYVVLHDAYQYFEAHYQLNGVGSVRLNPEIAPSLKRVQQLRESISESKIACIFKEPQFPAKRVLAVVRGLDVQLGSLDPMGSFMVGSDSRLVEDGYMPYDVFLTGLADSFTRCLVKANKD